VERRKEMLAELLSAWGEGLVVRVGESDAASSEEAQAGGLKRINLGKSCAEALSKIREALLKGGNHSRVYDGSADKRKDATAAPEATLSLGQGRVRLAQAGPKPSKTEIPAAPKCVDPKSMDKSVDPCVDFYQYACGTWMKNNPIPSDQSKWGTILQLRERNLVILKGILEEAAAKSKPIDGDLNKIGILYSSCMDEGALEALGSSPLKADLDKIASLQEPAGLPALLARLHAIGVGAFFGYGAFADFQDATMNLSAVAQGGISLPTKEFYFDEKFKGELEAYAAHVKKMFELLGQSGEQAAESAAAVLRVETALAQGSLSPVEMRDPKKTNHKVSKEDLQKLSPSFDWDAYLSAIGAPAFKKLNLMEPGFVQAFEGVIAKSPASDLRAYLSWHLLNEKAALLSSEFVNEHFEFYGKRLSGQKELSPRWKRCVKLVDAALGEALGKEYVAGSFGKEGKAGALDLINRIKKAADKDLRGLDWMSPRTKKKALGKLGTVSQLIGYPDKWRDYSSIDIRPGDLLGNEMRTSLFHSKRNVAKIGKPVDRSEWEMTPQTVNAYYDPTKNSINFPAGILQPPLFDAKADLAANLGAIGGVKGHELTHGFDDQGGQYDANGNLNNWWTKKDLDAFGKRAEGFIGQYAGYVVVKDPQDPKKDVHMNGKLTLGENIADNGGLRLAYMALKDSPKDFNAPPIDGFTPEQRLFLAWGQAWCFNLRDQAAKMQAASDPHSIPKFRVNGVVANMPEFAGAFSCQAGAPMVNTQPTRVW
jgi:endothelin-converting enzyme/putative endopeptidase